jgi:hypothetical protein
MVRAVVMLLDGQRSSIVAFGFVNQSTTLTDRRQIVEGRGNIDVIAADCSFQDRHRLAEKRLSLVLTPERVE